MQLRIGRRNVAETIAAILAAYAIEDVSVEDPPLEEVIAEVFSIAESGGDAEATAQVGAS